MAKKHRTVTRDSRRKDRERTLTRKAIRSRKYGDVNHAGIILDEYVAVAAARKGEYR